MADNLSRQAWFIGFTAATMLSSCAKISGLDDLKIVVGTGGTTSNGGGGNTGGATNSGGDSTTGGTTNNGDTGNTGGAANSGGDSTTGGTTSNAGAGNTGGATNSGGGAATGGTTSSGSGVGGNTGGTTGTACNAIGSGISEGDVRYCEDGGLVGPCAKGIQACRSDGAWSPCTIKPKAADTCVAGNDDNCSGKPNEGCSCINGNTQNCGDTTERGICHHGVRTCQSGQWGDCIGSVGPAARDCRSSADNDCDGLPDDTIDSVCQCKVDTTQDCGETHPGLDGKGQCRPGSRACIASANGASSSWGDCVSIGPTADVCDGIDNNCDGFIDEGCPCLGSGGPAMVRLPQGYCIDSTEVTRAQYAAWLATNPALPASTDANCSWNTTFTPDATCMASSHVCQSGCDNHPQVCVDWCDVYAYCQEVGKRLCGKIGGGANAYGDYANASLSQWYNACSSNGAERYPYGNTYSGTTCNSYDYWTPTYNYTTTPVGSLTGCQAPAPYAGVFDLSGNVWEWEDSCNGTSQSASCHIRGGACDNYGSPVGSYYRTCDVDVFDSRSFVDGNLGFRCCSP